MTYEEVIRMDGDRHAQTILELRENAERIVAAAKHRERRERIATAAMQGMLANPNVDPWHDKVAVDAVILADALTDALIAELDKEVQP